MTQLKKQKALDLVASLLGFLLLWEWLRPLPVVSDTERIDVFVLFTGLCILLRMLPIKWWLTIPLQIAGLLFLLRLLYSTAELRAATWIEGFFIDFTKNVTFVLQGDWASLTSLFRTMLFFLAIGLICYVLYEHMLRKQRILLFLLLTILYVAALDTFSPYDGDTAIVRTMVLGFFTLGLLRAQALVKDGFIKKRLLLLQLLLPLFACIVGVASFGYTMPKAAPQWPDPVPFLTSYSNSDDEAATGAKRIGYGADDSQLGGSLLPDDTVVFTAQVNKPHYWRVETKNIYTGKGWNAGRTGRTERMSFVDDNFALSWYEAKTKTEAASAKISLEQLFTHIIYPAGLLSIEQKADISYEAQLTSEKIYAMLYNRRTTLDQYSFSYQIPEFSAADLQAVIEGDVLEKDPSFVETYTQLPQALPKRVRDLAQQLTEGKENRYDKTLAIESYLKGSDFKYSLSDVAVPGENIDYVDQFLFETKIGYCNNFSTTMVVLLRSIGIPARWVKGYTEGTLDITADTPENMKQYTITNNNAHSWVEVYFPEYGWVPFEPTKGFTSPVSILDPATSTATEQAATAIQAAQANEQTAAQATAAQTQERVEEEKLAETASASSSISLSWDTVLAWLLGTALVSFLLFVTRSNWLAWLHIWRYRYQKDEASFSRAYTVLLQQLARTGLPRHPSQTLRDYARYVDEQLQMTAMQELTAAYEQVLYGKGTTVSWNRAWEDVMKRTVGGVRRKVG